MADKRKKERKDVIFTCAYMRQEETRCVFIICP